MKYNFIIYVCLLLSYATARSERTVILLSERGRLQISAKPDSPDLSVPEKIVPELSENDPKYWENIVPGRVIVGYHNNIDVNKASLTELGIPQNAGKGVTLVDRVMPSLNKDSPSLNCILVEVSEDINEMKNFIQLMKKNLNVKYAEPNREIKFFVNPNDQLFNQYQWDKRNLNAPAAWDYGWGSDSISIAILDCGIQYTHPDLQARYGTVKGYDTYSNDSDPKPEGNEQHGTHCSGNAAATINNGIGIAGISNSRLYALRIGGETGGNDYTAANGIQWCINNKVKVLSMSWGGPSGSSTLQNACQNAWNSGAVLCAATGNDYAETIQYPCGYPTVIAVGSIGTTNQRSGFSNYGSHMELVAPGENICSTVPGSAYQYGWNGTSMSCPEVAGCAALVWSANPSLTNQQVRDILTSTAVDIAPTGWDKYTGWGKPNLLAAVQKAIGIEESEKPKTQNSKLKIYPNPVSQRAEVRYEVANKDRVSLKLYDISGKLVNTLVDKEVDAGTYTASISTQGLSSGIYFLKFYAGKQQIVNKLILVE